MCQNMPPNAPTPSTESIQGQHVAYYVESILCYIVILYKAINKSSSSWDLDIQTRIPDGSCFEVPDLDPNGS